MNDTLWTFVTILTGILSGVIAHQTNPIISQSSASENFKLPTRYGIGWIAASPVFLLLRYLEQKHFEGKVPVIYQLANFILSGVLVGVGIMIPRFWVWIRD